MKSEVGNKYGKLTLIKFDHTDEHYRKHYLCKCDCGNEVVARIDCIKSGHTRSCGCLHQVPPKKHGKTGTRLYVVWRGMRKRCNNPNSNVYKYYGGCGVRVCEEWNTNFESFEKWALENGYDDTAAFGKFTVDRINPYGDYSPSNCRLITIQEQQRNKRRGRNKSENSVRQQRKVDAAG